jgi:hypothetical protein
MADTIQDFEIAKLQELKHNLGHYGSIADRALRDLNAFIIHEMESMAAIRPINYLKTGLNNLLYQLSKEIEERERTAFIEIETAGKR